MNSNWRVKKLGELAEYFNGKAFKQEEWSTSGLPIIRIQNLTGTQSQLNYFNGKLEDKYLISEGDILLSWSASLGVYIWNKGKAALNQHIFKVIPNKDKINKIFLYYLLQTKIQEMKNKVHGGTMKHITKNTFEKIQILLPSILEQRKIVEKLDAIRKTQELNDLQISKTEDLFESLLISEFKKIEKFYSKTLIEIAKVQRGKFTPRPRNDPKYFGGDIPWIQTGNITNSDGSINTFTQTLNKDGLKVSRLFPKGTILITIAANIGDLAILEIDAAFPDSIVGINPNESMIDTKFLYYQLKLKKDYFINQATQAAQKNINLQILSKVKVKIPTLKEQQKIVEKLDAVQNYKKLLLKQKDLLKELFDSVLDRCMKGEL